jgi:hypothetical protein
LSANLNAVYHANLYLEVLIREKGAKQSQQIPLIDVSIWYSLLLWSHWSYSTFSYALVRLRYKAIGSGDERTSFSVYIESFVQAAKAPQ